MNKAIMACIASWMQMHAFSRRERLGSLQDNNEAVLHKDFVCCNTWTLPLSQASRPNCRVSLKNVLAY